MGEKQDNVVLVRGDRKIGKTTLLNAIEKHSKFTERDRDPWVPRVQ